ncbi:MAG: isopeptide-forming domain-containing fimbrial protein [Oscillospiraceae bacterium]|nr:isopeptide-forming domain-containing fimbrial protein [Oscillospiraceae bacterium]
MNRLKKYASLLLALVMALALAVPAMATAATGTGSITISNASKGHTYEAYQIFKGDLSYDDKADGDLTNPVLSNVQWGDSVDQSKLTDALTGQFAGKTAAEIAAYLSDAETGGEATAREFAQAINGALTTPVKTGAVEEGATSCTIAEVPFGYYLIKDKAAQVPEGEDAPKDDAISLFMLQVVGPTTVASKVDVPTHDKKIVEDGEKKNTGDYDIGETITFELTAKLPNNFENYETYKLIFHDTMSAGLTFDAITEIKMGDTTLNAEQIEAVKDHQGQKLTVTFNNVKDYFPTATNNSVITVTYTAHLNENAVVGNPGNTNDMHLEYSNNPNDEGKGETGETPDKEVLVFTYELDGNKVDGQDKVTPLEGAEFVLKNAEGNGEGVQYAVINAATGKFIRWSNTRIDEKNDAGETTKLVSTIVDGKAVFKVIGIDAGTYWLEETKAPVGYNLPDPAETEIKIEATIKDNGGVTGVKDALESLTIQVNGATKPDSENPDGNPVPDTTPGENGVVSTTIENNKGATLPETGGIGTTIFYALGGLLTVGAVVLLVTKKRMSADEK